jgi:bacterioferritin
VRKVKENIEVIQKAVALAETQMDYVTRDLVQEILEKEENYLDWTTTQIDLIESVGIENYIQSQL